MPQPQIPIHGAAETRLFVHNPRHDPHTPRTNINVIPIRDHYLCNYVAAGRLFADG